MEMGSVKVKNELVVGTSSRCFLCLDQSASEEEPTTPPTDFLQYLSHYLKLDELAQAESYGLTIQLCDGCASLTETFSELYRQLEVIQMKVADSLQLIHGKLEQDGPIHQLGEDLEVLRTEALQKCSSKLRNLPPQIEIRRLENTEFEMEAPMDPPSLSSLSNDDDYDDDAPPTDWDNSNDFDTHLEELEGMEMEVDQIHDPAPPDQDQEDEQNWVAIQNYVEVEDATIPSPIVITPSVSHSSKSKYEYTINHQTGCYKCGICSKEYEKDTSFHYHYNSNHLRIRYQCPVPGCDKQFTSTTNFRKHHQVEHMGVRFACDNCGKVFRGQDHLRFHQKSVHAETGFKCKYCSQMFPLMAERNLHVKLYCPLNVNNPVTTKDAENYVPLGLASSSSSAQDPALPYECYICHDRFRKRKERTAHYQNHPCPHCGKRFKRITTLRDHIEAVHLGIRFLCGNPGCDKDCPDRTTLSKHSKLCLFQPKKNDAEGSRINYEDDDEVIVLGSEANKTEVDQMGQVEYNYD